jgi:hypothetical protein
MHGSIRVGVPLFPKKVNMKMQFLKRSPEGGTNGWSFFHLTVANWDVSCILGIRVWFHAIVEGWRNKAKQHSSAV